MIDTHCHLTYPGLIERFDDVMKNALAAGVDRVITVGTSPDDARAAMALSRRHDSVFVAAGLHPNHATADIERAWLIDNLRAILSDDRVVAIGELGLDRYHTDPPIQTQIPVLRWQLELAQSTDLPIIVHNRMATDDTLAVLRESGIAGERFVFHCFTGSDAELDAILSFGAMVSFTGVVTFKSAMALLASSARVPVDRIMIETDAPYLTPEPHRKVKTNEPGYVPFVARALAQKRGMDEGEFLRAIDANSRRFFARLR